MAVPLDLSCICGEVYSAYHALTLCLSSKIVSGHAVCV
jgi:hypothetical protein